MEINPVFPSAVDDIVVKEITAGYFISRSFSSYALCALRRHAVYWLSTRVCRPLTQSLAVALVTSGDKKGVRFTFTVL